MPNKRKPNRSYNYMYLAVGLICVIIAVLIGALISYGTFGKNKNDVSDENASESSLEISAEESLTENSAESQPEPPEENNEGLPADIKFDDMIIPNSDINKGLLPIITPENAGLVTAENLELVRFYGNKGEGYALSGTAVTADKTAQKNFDKFLTAFAETVEKSGIIIDRGYTSKETLKKGNILDEYADLTAGSSVKLGLSGTDHTFEDTEFSYLYEQAYKYGIIQRFPANKKTVTGHEENKMLYRYIGLAHSQYMHKYNLTLEEYLEIVKNNEKPLEIVSELESGVKYLVYYSKAAGGATDTSVIKVPSDDAKYPYEISGNGSDGFIVTVRISSIA